MFVHNTTSLEQLFKYSIVFFVVIVNVFSIWHQTMYNESA